MYKIKFSYTVYNDESGFHRITTCKVYKGEKLLSFADSYKHPKDRDNKMIAKKKALVKAICYLPRSERVDIWEAFFNMPGHHKSKLKR